MYCLVQPKEPSITMVKKLLDQILKLINWFLRFLSWLPEWSVFLYGLGLPGYLILLCYSWDWDKNSIALIGVVIQLLAIGIVFYEMDSTLKIFDKESGVFFIWKERWSRRPPFTPKTMVSFGDGDVVQPRSQITTALAQPFDMTSDRLKERVEMLEKQFTALYNQQVANDKENGIKIDAIHKMINQEEQNRDKSDNEISFKLQEVSTGGLPIAGMGLFWLFCGIIMSSIPEKIEATLNAIHQF